MLNYLNTHRKLIIGIAIFCYILIALICIANGKMGGDEGIWSYIGRIWVENDMPPYQDAVENKTPGIFYIYALSHILWGINFIFPRILGLLFILATGGVIFKIGDTLKNNLSGAFAAIIFCFSMLMKGFDSPYIANTEVFMIFFTSLAFYLFLNKPTFKNSNLEIFTIGFLFGLAIAFKQIAVVTLLAFLLYLAFSRGNSLNSKILSIIVLVIGVLISTGISYLPLAFFGVTIFDYIEGAWIILMNEASHFSSSTILWRLPRFIEEFFYGKIAFFYPILLLGYIHRKSLLINTNNLQLLILWLVFSTVGANASGYYFEHHLIQILPPLSLITGIIIGSYIKKIGKSNLIPVSLILILFMPLQLFVNNMANILNYAYKKQVSFLNSFESHTKGFSDKKELGYWIRKRTKKDDFIFARRLTMPVSYSNRLSSTKYFNSIFITTSLIESWVLKDLQKNKPKFIIENETYEKLPKIDKFKNEHYSKVKTFKEKYTIYRLD